MVVLNTCGGFLVYRNVYLISNQVEFLILIVIYFNRPFNLYYLEAYEMQ